MSTYQEGSFWFYAPNKGAAISFAILFAASGLCHVYQCIKYKSWKMSGLLPWSATVFVAGFALRAVGAFGEWDNLPIFIASQVLILAAPPVYETANFIILGRILYYVPWLSPIHPGRVITTFLGLGAVVEAISINGAILLSNREATPAKQELGHNLMKAALILQIVIMILFITLAHSFQRRVTKAGLFNANLRKPLTVLYTSCALIISRTIFRTVEHFVISAIDFSAIRNVNTVHPLLRQEAYFWCFEVIFMFANTSLLNVFHPAKYLPVNNKIYLNRQGEEIEGPGYKEERNFILTILDPFDIGGLIRGKDKESAFWDTQEKETARKDAKREQNNQTV